jgi:hypothetical protein
MAGPPRHVLRSLAMLQKRWLYAASVMWSGLVAIIPTIFGVIMLHDPPRSPLVTVPGVSAADVLGTNLHR